MLACGTVCHLSACAGAESCTQICGLLGDIRSRRDVQFIVYDSACMLAPLRAQPAPPDAGAAAPPACSSLLPSAATCLTGSMQGTIVHALIRSTSCTCPRWILPGTRLWLRSIPHRTSSGTTGLDISRIRFAICTFAPWSFTFCSLRISGIPLSFLAVRLAMQPHSLPRLRSGRPRPPC